MKTLRTPGGERGDEDFGIQKSFAGSSGMKNTVLQLVWNAEIQFYSTGKEYLLFTIQFLEDPKPYFRYYTILFKIALNSLFIE